MLVFVARASAATGLGRVCNRRYFECSLRLTKPHSHEWLCYLSHFAAGAVALKSAVWETMTIQRPLRLAITKLA
jgi:hypothetical protein